jgi:hypothetical protein
MDASPCRSAWRPLSSPTGLRQPGLTNLGDRGLGDRAISERPSAQHHTIAAICLPGLLYICWHSDVFQLADPFARSRVAVERAQLNDVAATWRRRGGRQGR